MHVRAGTSGFSYPAWRGSFYPERLPAARMLGHYASRFSTVEINTSFYGLPSTQTLARWYAQVPDGFQFALKAPRRITHELKLRGAAELAGILLERIAELGPRLGPILFQLPPSLRADPGLLEGFLESLPEGLKAAFEFRHPSWFVDPVLALLQRHHKALCVSDTDDGDPVVEPVGSWGYLRMRRDRYGPRDLEAWAQRLLRLPWEEAFAFFKHEDGALGPKYAASFERLFQAAPQDVSSASMPPP